MATTKTKVQRTETRAEKRYRVELARLVKACRAMAKGTRKEACDGTLPRLVSSVRTCFFYVDGAIKVLAAERRAATRLAKVSKKRVAGR